MATPANINTLTQYAKGVFQDTANPDADFLAPVVATGAARFLVNDYAQETGFAIPSSVRAIGGDSAAVRSDGEQVEISLKPHGLHDTIDNHELDLATDGAGTQLLYEGRTQNLISQGGNSRFKETLDVVRGVVAATPTVWNAAADPIAMIDARIEAITKASGKMPNRIMFSLGAWIIFRNNTKVIERHPGAGQVTVTAESASGLFANPNMKIMVSATVFDTAKGSTPAKGFALANEVFIYFAAEGASMFDASFTKTFRVRANAFQSVRTSQKDHGVKLMVDWTEVCYVNNPAAGARLTVTTS